MRFKTLGLANSSDVGVFEDLGELSPLLDVKDIEAVPPSVRDAVVREMKGSSFPWRLSDNVRNAQAKAALKLLVRYTNMPHQRRT